MCCAVTFYSLHFARFNLPSRRYFTSKITPAVYDEVYSMVRQEVGKATYYAATTDMWSSRTTDPYMSFTVHWVDADFILKSRSLQVGLNYLYMY